MTSPTSSPSIDVIDQLAGVAPGSRLDRVRRQRPESRDNAQASFDALFAPEHPGSVTALERAAVAAFVVGTHQDAVSADYYADRLRALDKTVADAVAAEVERGATTGPFGRYREPGLSGESTTGPAYAVSAVADLPPRLAAALEHAHALVFRPRESTASALQVLLDAGWSEDDIVTLSQLIAFLSFQVRAVVGLRALADAPDHSAAADIHERVSA